MSERDKRKKENHGILQRDHRSHPPCHRRGHDDRHGHNTLLWGAAFFFPTVRSLFSVDCYGSANATAILVGKMVGEGRATVIRPCVHSLQAMFCVIGVSSGALLFFGMDLALTFYTSLTPESYAPSEAFLVILAITLVETSNQVACTTGIICGGGDTKFVLILDSLFMWLIVIPLACLAAFVFHLDPIIVFICLKCDQILKCAVAFIRDNCCKYRWIKKIDRGTEVTEA